MIINFNKALCFVSSVCLLGLSFAEEIPVSLKPDFQVGKRYEMKQSVNQTTQMGALGGGSMKMKLDLAMDLSVNKGAPGEKLVAINFDSMVMEMDVAGQKIKMDANDPAQKQTMGPLLEMNPTLIYSNENEFLRIEGMDNNSDPTLQKMMNPDSLKQMVNGMLDALPDEQVSVKDAWDYETSLPIEGIGEMKGKTYFYVEKIEKMQGSDCVKILFDGRISGDFDSVQGKMSIDEGKMSGHFHFDPSIGYIRAQTLDTDVVVKLSVPGKGEIEMPVKQKQKLVLTAVKSIPERAKIQSK